jgi:hypothetical protein
MTTELPRQRAGHIAQLNDSFRHQLADCQVTRGIAELDSLVSDILNRVRNFSEFTEDNDPYDEHDFGAFIVLGVRVFWKIDYYDQNLSHWCDPLDARCRRILTVMRADEY